MNAVHIVAVSDFRNNAKDVLDQARKAPVILTQRSHPAAVVVDYETYQAQMKLLEELELKLDELLLAQTIQSSKELVSLGELIEDYETSNKTKLSTGDR